MFIIPKDLEVARLIDFYGNCLSQRQHKTLTLYYNEDLSLSEISELLGISRQAVMDSIKRGEKALLLFEEKLCLVKNFNKREKLISMAIDIADSLLAVTAESDFSDKISKIKDILYRIV